MGLPNFKIFFQQEELNTSTQAWMNAIRTTRYLAIKTQTRASLHWQNDNYIDQENRLKYTIHSIAPEIKIRFRASFARDDELTFLPNGFTEGQQGHFELCLKNTQRCQKIVVLSSGVVRLAAR